MKLLLLFSIMVTNQMSAWVNCFYTSVSKQVIGRPKRTPVQIFASPIDDLLITSSSFTIAEDKIRTFEPLMDVQTTGGLLAVILLTTVAGSFWWNIIVPQKRTELSLSKGKGEIKEYLDELREAEGEDSRGLERWLFTDWLRKTPGSMKPGALPFLKKAKWNSGDNPVLVAFGAIMACVVAASLAERAFH